MIYAPRAVITVTSVSSGKTRNAHSPLLLCTKHGSTHLRGVLIDAVSRPDTLVELTRRGLPAFERLVQQSCFSRLSSDRVVPRLAVVVELRELRCRRVQNPRDERRDLFGDESRRRRGRKERVSGGEQFSCSMTLDRVGVPSPHLCEHQNELP